jgi:hypothetical protein
MSGPRVCVSKDIVSDGLRGAAQSQSGEKPAGGNESDTAGRDMDCHD